MAPQVLQPPVALKPFLSAQPPSSYHGSLVYFGPLLADAREAL
jgi:hypothetical protein